MKESPLHEISFSTTPKKYTYMRHHDQWKQNKLK